SVIKTIRTYDKDGVILVGTPNWSQMVDQAAADPIKGYKNLMYTLHFYAATHTDWLRNTLETAYHQGLPIFVTEYGICDASGNGAVNNTEANKWMKLLDRYQISSCIWNLSNKNESSALIKAGCTKKTGWKSSDLSQSGKWFVKMIKG
ncbi:MAG: cellulase family glycosylhydrolase, partial [Lachnospiraceae bacterium]|nr:cellulase family glycosylhydrolase [Lachnospiraceae bacterium]